MRRIPLSRRSHIIGFQPLATGTTEHESALERDLVTLTSFLYLDVSITSQPITLSFRDGATARRYTPDILVRRPAGLAELVEALLPLRRPSHLAAPALADKILSAAEGILGEVVSIVTRAAVRAVTSGTEAITAKLIDETGFISPSQRRRIAV